MIANFNALRGKQGLSAGLVNFNPWQVDPTSIPKGFRGLGGMASGLGQGFCTGFPPASCPPGMSLFIASGCKSGVCLPADAGLNVDGQGRLFFDPNLFATWGVGSFISGPCGSVACKVGLMAKDAYNPLSMISGVEHLTVGSEGTGVTPLPDLTAPAIQTGGGTVTPTHDTHSGLLVPLTFSFSNITNPLQATNLRIGDQWKLIINGPPGARVYSNGGKNGQVSTNFYLGQTDGNGQLVITGSAGSGDVGNWLQYYSLEDGTKSSTLTFSISAGGPTAGGAGTTVESSGGSTSTPSGASPTPGPSSAPGFLEENVSIAGFNVPMWMLLAGVGAGLYFLSGKHKR